MSYHQRGDEYVPPAVCGTNITQLAAVDDEHLTNDDDDDDDSTRTPDDDNNKSETTIGSAVQSLQTNGVIVTDGWLLLRSRFSKEWKKRWFVLDGVDLRYGKSDTKINARISLDGARIREADKDAKRHAFCVEPRSGHRIYYLQADDSVSRMKWMQAMCFAKFSSHRGSEDEDIDIDNKDIFRRLPCAIS